MLFVAHNEEPPLPLQSFLAQEALMTRLTATLTVFLAICAVSVQAQQTEGLASGDSERAPVTTEAQPPSPEGEAPAAKMPGDQFQLQLRGSDCDKHEYAV